MAEQPMNPDLRNALRQGLIGVALITAGIIWVFVRPEDAMFGIAEGLAFVGMVAVMGAGWRAAEAGLGPEDER